MTGEPIIRTSCFPGADLLLIVPAIIYIDRWGRRPMLLAGTLAMGFWLYLVGGLQGRFGDWGELDGKRELR